jgi:hypothetical protein
MAVLLYRLSALLTSSTPSPTGIGRALRVAASFGERNTFGVRKMKLPEQLSDRQPRLPGLNNCGVNDPLAG